MKQRVNLLAKICDNMIKEEVAQVSFEYLLATVFAIILAISAAVVIETLRQIALDAQAQLLTNRARVIEEILR